MYGSGDPHRAHLTSGQNPVNLTYAPSPESSQVSATSGPPSLERNIVFLMPQQYCPPVANIASSSNGTTEFGSSHVLTDSGQRCAIGDLSNSSTSVIPGNALPLSGFSLVKPVQGSSQPTLYNPAGINVGASFASQNSYLTPLLSQPTSPQLSTQSPMLPQHFVLQPQPPTQQQQQQQQLQPPPPPQQQQQPSSPQAFIQQSSGAVPAAAHTLMFISADPGNAPGGSFYSLQPASPQMAAAMQGATAHIISPVQLSSPNPPIANVQGQVAYVVNTTAPPALVSYSAYPEHFVTLQGPTTWQNATTVAVRQAPPAPPAPPAPHTPPSSQSFLAISSAGGRVMGMPPVMPSYTPPSSSTPPVPPVAAPRHNLSGGGGHSISSASGAPAAASGSPGSAQPAALGVRSFMAPHPVGSCMVRDAPLIPTIPPLALPCPAWGKIPTGPISGHKEGGSTSLLT